METNGEFEGTAELVTILSMIARARLAFPENPKIKTLDDASKKVMDPNLCQALLMQVGQLQEETSRQRHNPLANIIGDRR